MYQHIQYDIQYDTFFYWNLCITVGIFGSLGQKKNPVFHLGHTAINTVTGALTPKADNSNLRESKYIKQFINCDTLFWIFTCHSRPPSAGLQSLPGMSPSHCCCHRRRCGS